MDRLLVEGDEKLRVEKAKGAILPLLVGPAISLGSKIAISSPWPGE